jgi:cell division protein FtsW
LHSLDNMAVRKGVDKPFFVAVVSLVTLGFFVFASASLGLLARDGASFSSVAVSQILFGMLGGSILLFVFSRLPPQFWRKHSLAIFIVSIVVVLLVFVPGIGVEHAGARRWLSVFGFSFQPAELLKLGFVLYFATWLAGVRDKIHTFSFGIIPFLLILGGIGILLLMQPDTGTFLVIAAAALCMYVVAGARFRDIAIVGGLGVVFLTVLALLRPYVMDRILTFLNPALDPLGASYQLQQALIAIGSGGWFGRGFGQSIQKFHYLPEPIGDSIFAVAGEEFGFIGGIILISLFLFFAYRGFTIASRSPDQYGGLVAVGIVILIVAQSFIHIASIVGVLPLTGVPLLFISHGGTALLFALAEVGIVLSISRQIKYK